MTSGEKSAGCELSARQQGAIESLFADLPEPYDERYSALQSLRSAFYREVARQLEPTLNAYAKSQPLNTLDERSALSSWINGALRHLGLALVSPRGNEPAILIADTAGQSRKPGFRFQITEASGKRVRTVPSDELPDLELMQAPARVENLAKEFRGRRHTERFR
jgi:hypothetical protein